MSQALARSLSNIQLVLKTSSNQFISLSRSLVSSLLLFSAQSFHITYPINSMYAYVLVRAQLAQILTVVANVLVVSLMSCLTMVITPFHTRYAFMSHIANQPLSDQIQIAFTGFSKKRYMIHQEGGKVPIKSSLTVLGLSFAGIVFLALSTIVFQVSHTELKNSIAPNAPVKGFNGMAMRTLSNSDTDAAYPAIDDSVLGPAPNMNKHQTRVDLPSKYWNSNIGKPSDTVVQFSGDVIVSLGNANWLTVNSPNNMSTSIYMNIDGITAESLPVTKPGTVKVQVIKDSLPAVFDLPYIELDTETNSDNTYAFAIDGISTLDYVQFSLLKFDAQSYDGADCLDKYYQYLGDQASFVNDNGTLLFNTTYDYQTMQSYDKSQLEQDLAAGGQDDVRYALLSARNTTSDNDKFQTYSLTKRSAHRENTVSTAHGTISLVEYHYRIQVTSFSKTDMLNDAFKIKITRQAPAGGVAIPITPFFKSSQADFISIASLTNYNHIYQSYFPETYIDLVPMIILMSIYAAIIACCLSFSLWWNLGRFQKKAYSIPLQMINYIFYNPGNTLHPLMEKVGSIELSMTDGYDPLLGYNHLGIMSVDDAKRITAAEPDVPYGQIYQSSHAKSSGEY